MVTFYQDNLLEERLIRDLRGLVPSPLIPSRQRLKGYSTDPVQNCFSSYLTAGEYYPVEPSIFSIEFWQQIMSWIEDKLGFPETDACMCRCQLNVILDNAIYHPLSISPHADSLSSDFDVAAINIPIESCHDFLTGFWLNDNHGMKLGSARNKNSGSYSSNPFSANKLETIIDENPSYTDSQQIRLPNWTLDSIKKTKIGSGILYDGRLFHAPYLRSHSSIQSGHSTLRISLAIFLAYSARNPYQPISQDSLECRRHLYQKIISTMKTKDGVPVPYEIR